MMSAVGSVLAFVVVLGLILAWVVLVTGGYQKPGKPLVKTDLSTRPPSLEEIIFAAAERTSRASPVGKVTMGGRRISWTSLRTSMAFNGFSSPARIEGVGHDWCVVRADSGLLWGTRGQDVVEPMGALLEEFEVPNGGTEDV